MNKITLEQFWNSNISMAIHCDTEKKANKLCKAFDDMGETWFNRQTYLNNTWWHKYKENTCYMNWGGFCNINCYNICDFIIYKFEDVELN